MMVLLVEDDARLRSRVIDGLEAHGISFTEASTAAEARSALDGPACDAVILEISSSDGAGLDALARLQDQQSERLCFGRVELDLAGRRLLVDGDVVEIAAVEFDLLAFLAGRAGQAYTRSELLTEVWHSDSEWQSLSTVTEHIRRVRNKIEVDPHHPVLLRTIRGVGYRFDLPEAC